MSLDRQSCGGKGECERLLRRGPREEGREDGWRDGGREMGHVFFPFHALCPPSESQQPVFLAAVEQGTCLGFFLSSVSRSW